MLCIIIVGCSSKKENLFDVVTYNCEIENKDLNLQFEFDGEVELPLEKMCDSYKLLQDSIMSIMFGDEFIGYSAKKALKVYADSSFVEYEKVYEEIYENNPLEPIDTFNFETNIKGMFAAGDCVKKNLRQIVTAVSDGALAATSIIRYLQKNIFYFF